MKKTIYILIICLFTAYYSHAQISGYMGNRWALMYDIHTRPSFTLPNQNGNNGLTSLNIKNSIGLEYVIAEHTSFGAAYSFFNTKFDFRNIDVGYINTIDGKTYSLLPNGFGDMSVKGYSMYFKFFKTANLAPLGAYVKLQLDYFKWDCSNIWNKNIFIDNNGIGTPIAGTISTNGSNSSLGLSMSFGKQVFYFDHFVLNSSLQFGYLFHGGHTLVIGENNVDVNNLSTDEAMKDASSARMFSHYLWNLNIGIGYIIF